MGFWGVSYVQGQDWIDGESTWVCWGGGRILTGLIREIRVGFVARFEWGHIGVCV